MYFVPFMVKKGNHHEEADRHRPRNPSARARGALTFADGNRSRVYLARVKAYRITGLPQGFDGDLGHMQRSAKLTLTSTAIQE